MCLLFLYLHSYVRARIELSYHDRHRLRVGSVADLLCWLSSIFRCFPLRLVRVT